jgi:hypothetical protein
MEFWTMGVIALLVFYSNYMAGPPFQRSLGSSLQLARVGLNEKQAKARSISYRLIKLPMEANLRARS